MSGFIDLTCSFEVQSPKSKMSIDEFEHLISEVEKKFQSEPRSANIVLRILKAANLTLLQIEKADAEKRIRKVSATPL